MFSLTTMTPAKLAGTIRLRKPVTSLGNYEDVNGVVWNVRGIIGSYVQACRLDELHPYWGETTSKTYSLAQQTWLPYEVEVVHDT